MKVPMIYLPALRRRRQRGTSLIIAMIALVGLSAASVAMLRSADTTSLVAGAMGFQESATRASELAIETGIAAVTALSADGRKNNNAGINYFASLESVNLEPTATRLSETTTAAVSDTQTGNTARYVVERLCSSTGAAAAATCIMDAGQAVYRVTALTLGPRYASETTQATFTVNEAIPACGIMTEKSMTVSGESYQYGTSKCYHSNAGSLVSGALRTAGHTISAVGTASYTGGGMAVTTQSSASGRVLPTVSPATHQPYARQVFRSNGTITGTGFNAGHWKWDSGSKVWILDADLDTSPPTAGLYYFETNVEIGKKLGRAGAPATISIVSAMSIKISAEVYLRDFTDASHPAATNQIFIMSSGDLELPGGSSYLDTSHSSMLIAGAELKVNGSVTIEGNLVARNEALPAGAQNWVSENIVSGTLTQTYGSNAGGAAASASRHGWRLVAR